MKRIYILIFAIIFSGCANMSCDNKEVVKLVGKNISKTEFVKKDYQDVKNQEFALAFLDEIFSNKLPQELEPIGEFFANIRNKNCDNDNIVCKFAKALNKAKTAINEDNIVLANFKKIAKNDEKIVCEADMWLTDNDGNELLDNDMIIKYQAWLTNDKTRVKILDIREKGE